ncbi:uncharacterized protein LOC125228379 [Leguminivora glycinivorella]|uniref:uncharacterized protein LOC125228379 n=1 Tax=Leguminivora glycinivorella TaxID=1035111 RepID=UPI00200DFA8D|nr:uncharacterized protein LOC125228379 [Leguminivora glycinivorella]
MVGKICTVCKQSSAANKSLSFFIYPSDRERRYEWLKAVDRLDLLDKLVDSKSRGNHRICEAHFHDSFIKKCDGLAKSRKCLTKDALPCLEHVNQAFLMNESSSNRKKIKHRKRKLIKTDETANNINEPDNMDPVASECENTGPVSEMEISPDEIKVEKIDEDTTMHISSPELTGFPDLSQFCESVMKVTKETQTSQDADRRRKLDPFETNEQFIQSCSKNLSKGMVQLIKWQLNNKDNADNYKFHMFALNLYFSGANSYNLLKDMMGLPDINALKKLIVPQTTKFDNKLINALKIKVANMSAREKICSLSISSMPVKPSLYYNITRDKVEGFHEIDGVQKIEPAKYALVFIAQGIVEKWTQPIAHAFISHLENSPDISIWVEEIITLLIDVGLDMRAFVSDPETEILYMLESQKVTPEKTYFSINDKNIYYIYDTKKLRKTVESHLNKCHFYIKGSCSEDDDNNLFAKKFNKLCHMLNSKTHVIMSPFKRAFSDRKYQRTFLDNFLLMLQNLKVIRKNDEKDITKSMKFIESIQISIISVIQLYSELKKLGAKMLLTSRLSQNSNDKFSAMTRSKGKKGSTRHFKRTFSRCFVYSMLKKPAGDRKADSASGPQFRPQSLLSVGKHVNQTIKVATTDYRLALPDKKKFETVCRYLYLKCIDHHSCNTFRDYLSRCPESRQYVPPYRSSALLDIRNCKLVPPQSFKDFIMILEKRFRDYCRQDVKINSIGHQILKKISSFEFETPCQCFPLDYLKKLFVRLRIYYAVRENNNVRNRDKNQLFKNFIL